MFVHDSSVAAAGNFFGGNETSTRRLTQLIEKTNRVRKNVYLLRSRIKRKEERERERVGERKRVRGLISYDFYTEQASRDIVGIFCADLYSRIYACVCVSALEKDPGRL